MRTVTTDQTCHTRNVDDCSANLHKRDCILDPQERAAEQQADRSIESFYGRSGDRATLTTYSGVIHQAIESAEPFYGEFQQRFSVGRACGVRSVKRDVRAQFYFESFPFFARTTTKNHFGAFFDETSDDPFSYPSGTAGNDDNLVF
jgi:hypothetical protein